jgi:hypothetical protein
LAQTGGLPVPLLDYMGRLVGLCLVEQVVLATAPRAGQRG